jgi:uncharacterized protein
VNPGCERSAPADVRAGIAMYNRGEYYECHEVLEDAWRAESDPVRSLYQGILQIGVAFHHLGNQNWRGAVGLLTRGIGNVEPFSPRCQGIDTGRLLNEAQGCLAQLHDLGPDQIDRFDWSSVPRIHTDWRSDERC